MTEDCRATPNGPERAQPCFVEDVEGLQILVDRLGALDVQDDRERALGDAPAEIGHGAHHLDLALRLGLEPKQIGHHGQRP